MAKRKLIIIAAIVLALAGGFAAYQYFFVKNGAGLTIYGNVDIRTVNLGFRVGGKLEALLVDEGDRVEPGQVLGHLDSQPYENAFKQAQAVAMAQKAQFIKLEAGFRAEEIEQARALAQERRTALAYADKLYRRQVELLPSKAVSVNDVDNARTLRDQAQAAYDSAQAQLQLYETGNRVEDIAAAKAALLQAEAALAQAELNRSDTLLTAPSAGTVLTRAVEPGTMLAAGSPVLGISLSHPVWVRAYVDGANLARAVPGTRLKVYNDSRREPYTGSIGFVSPTAEFTPKSVQTPELRSSLVYRLRIIVEDPDDALRQGMPVTIVFSD